MATKKTKNPEMIEGESLDQEVIILKNDTIINGELLKAGTQIEATAEMKKLLKPFGYFITKKSENV